MEDIRKMYLLPPNCPVYPQSYTQFFNDISKLESVNPYKIDTLQNRRNGGYYSRIQYNNFYSDWKKDATKWNLPNTREYETIDYDIDRNINTNINKNIKLYQETKNKTGFAQPLATNGTNKLNIVFNPNCQNNTFNYKRYASLPINNKKWFNNPLYASDISIETMNMKKQYMNDRLNENEIQMTSIIDDMYSLTEEGYDNEYDNEY